MDTHYKKTVLLVMCTQTQTQTYFADLHARDNAYPK